jgi:two-component system sensor histidine kinase AlgZ
LSTSALTKNAIAASATTQRNDFFIPDLCQVQAVLFLVLTAELLALVLVLVDTGLHTFDWQDFALRSLFIQWVVLLSAALLCQLRNYLAVLPLARAAALSYLLILAVVGSSSIGAQLLHSGSFLADGTLHIDGWRIADHVVISAVFAGITLRYFYLSYQLQARQQAALASQLEALQARIRPHFLFNTMNSIASLIAIDPLAAEKAIEDLSALFRASLADADAETTLAKELETCHGYLRIEQWRLGNRLRVHWQIDEQALNQPIPALSLQPLLENAIYHGIQPRADGGDITINITLNDGFIQLDVKNPLPDVAAPRTGNHLALNNIRHRLQALYGDDAQLIIERDHSHYTATLRYRPQRSTPDKG